MTLTRRGASPASDILVVDDTPENLLAIEAALEGLSLNLVKASSGPEALRCLLERDVALILLDVQMPAMDGYETARLIRARRRNQHVPIIFITAFDRTDEQVIEAYRLGAVDFLFKPVEPEVLRAKAQVFVDLQRRTVEVARQAEQLRHHEQEERERALADQRRRLEAEALRQRLIEERVHAEELERLNRELADADRRKDEFLAILAHELRNPLAPLVTGLAILEGAADKRDIARTVETMSRQTNQLVRLVDDLLDVSRITRGKMELRRAPVRAGEVIDHAVSMAMPELAERHHELLQRRSCDDLMLVADEVRLAQVICNLLCNAARYTDPGGRIELEVSRADGGMAVAVTDNGRGIAPEMIGRVFEPFVQGETGGVGGLGLGLSLVRALTEGHGGTVRAHSDGPGAGSRFEVWLPAGDEASAGDAVILPRRRDTSAPPATGPLHVVLIEDNDDVREMTGELLRMWGHRISEAACGAEGIDLITREKPDVALVDLGLPDIEGYAVARAVRENLGDDSPRLVALSGFGQAQDRARSFEVGFDEHLAKPASTSDLKRVIVPRHASRTA